MSLSDDNRTWYEILHVSRDAPVAIIRGSYRALMQSLKCHPDLGGDTERAALINKAYAVLSNPDRRAAYDAKIDLTMANQAAAQGTTKGRPADDDVQPTAEAPRRPASSRLRCMFCDTPHRRDTVVNADAGCHACGSPLAPVSGIRSASTGQRSIVRLQKTKQLHYLSHWPQAQPVAAQTRDISLSGLSFETGELLAVGQRLKIATRVLDAVGEVTRCEPVLPGGQGGWVVGVSFLTLRFVQSIGGFVSEQA